ncbi:MAG: GldG family protein [Anaerolineales bacterium]|jgi:ABC-type uncharacterized transport system involved in gliding motility auxiliary subunit
MAKKTKNSRKLPLHRYASIGLWISGVAVLAGIILLIVKLIAFMGLYTISNTKAFNWGLLGCLSLLIIGLAVYALMDPNRVRQLITGRQARYGSNAVILLIAFLGILIVVNVIAYQYPLQGDWTEDKQNTLAPETLAALKALPGPVHAIGFYTSNSSTSDAQKLLTSIRSKSNGKFSFEFVDPNLDPTLATQYQITQDASTVLILGNNKEVLTSLTEQDFTNGLVRLMNPGHRAVYFLTGHGEADIQTTGQTAFTLVSTALSAKNYTVQSLNLLAQGKVPADAKAVIVAGPSQPLSAQETALLADYLSHGGALVVMEAPTFFMQGNSSTTSTTITPVTDPLADYLASTWGITLDNDLVIDPAQSQVDIAVADTQNYGSHPITNQLKNRDTFFVDARSLTEKTITNVSATVLVKTLSDAWGLTDFSVLKSSSQQLTYDPTKDLPGPLNLAIAAENTSNNGRLVVIGNSEFADDTFFNQYANGDLLINSVDWAAGQENQINLTAKTPITRQLKVIDNLTLLVIGIVFVFLLPLAVVAGGVASWLVRRSRG